MRSTLALLMLAASVGSSSGQQRPDTAGSNRIEMKVERKEGADWKLVDPALVFSRDDRLRFKFRTNFDGYLYVMNQGTSGDYTLLFPRQDTGEQNRIEAGKEYAVPSTQGSFRVTGPAGHDVVFWMISPIELKSGDGSTRSGYVPLPPPPSRSATSSGSLRPRCDDAIFRARGECIDTAAGPRSITEKSSVPDHLSRIPKTNSRELIFIREQERAVVSSPVPLKGPVIYEFRLAHN
jgi:hypothetical protein